MHKRKISIHEKSWYFSKGLCATAVILACCSIASASVIPSPELPYGTDSVRTPDGFQCSSSVAPSSYIDSGVFQNNIEAKSRPDRGIYVRVLIPIYSDIKRLDCSQLYKQALKERKLNNIMLEVKSSVFD